MIFWIQNSTSLGCFRIWRQYLYNIPQKYLCKYYKSKSSDCRKICFFNHTRKYQCLHFMFCKEENLIPTSENVNGTEKKKNPLLMINNNLSDSIHWHWRSTKPIWLLSDLECVREIEEKKEMCKKWSKMHFLQLFLATGWIRSYTFVSKDKSYIILINTSNMKLFLIKDVKTFLCHHNKENENTYDMTYVHILFLKSRYLLFIAGINWNFLQNEKLILVINNSVKMQINHILLL